MNRMTLLMCSVFASPSAASFHHHLCSCKCRFQSTPYCAYCSHRCLPTGIRVILINGYIANRLAVLVKTDLKLYTCIIGLPYTTTCCPLHRQLLGLALTPSIQVILPPITAGPIHLADTSPMVAEVIFGPVTLQSS